MREELGKFLGVHRQVDGNLSWPEMQEGTSSETGSAQRIKVPNQDSRTVVSPVSEDRPQWKPGDGNDITATVLMEAQIFLQGRVYPAIIDADLTDCPGKATIRETPQP